VTTLVPLPANLPAGAKVTAKQANGQPLPSWLVFDPAKGKFEGTPPPGFSGTVTINVAIPQRGGSTTTRAVTITVP
jgi:hypothetical protein